MLLYSIQVRWHNCEREQDQEQVVKHDRTYNPEKHPESILERTDQHFNINNDHYGVEDIVTFEDKSCLLPSQDACLLECVDDQEYN